MKRLILFMLTALMMWSFQQSGISETKTKIISGKIYWKCDKHFGYIPLDSVIIKSNEYDISEAFFYINIRQLTVSDLDSAQFSTAKMILENTLKNEFFEVDSFPLAYFHLQEIHPSQNNKYPYRLKGDMHMHGQTVCIEFPAILSNESGILRIESDVFKIDRTDWGIYRLSPKRPYPDDEHGWTVPDTVEIHMEIELKIPDQSSSTLNSNSSPI